jgi:hypothetical protein
MPRDDDFNLDLSDYSVDFVDRYVGYFPKHLKLLFPLGLILLEIGPIIFSGRFKFFSKLDLKERERHVDIWVNSRRASRRDLIKGVKGLVLVAFYSHPRVMEYIGYDIEAHISAALSRGY